MEQIKASANARVDQKERPTRRPDGAEQPVYGETNPRDRARYLNVLLIEDSPADAKLEIRQLRHSGFEVSADVTETEAGFIERVRSKAYDVILADYKLSQWTGIEALDVLRKEGLEIPVILVTGAVGEETATEWIKRGIADYVLKDRLARLPSVVQRALQETTERRKRQAAEEALRDSEARHRRLFETAQNGILVVDAETERVMDANPAALEMLDSTRGEVTGSKPWEIAALERAGATRETFAGWRSADLTIHQSSGLLVDVEFLSSTYRSGNRKVVQCSLRDVTFRRRAELETKALTELLEEQVAERTAELETANRSLAIEIEDRKRGEEALGRLHRETELILNCAGEAIFRLSLDGRCTFANPAASRVLGFSREELLGQTLHTLCQHRRADGSDCPPSECQLELALSRGTVQAVENQIFTRKDGVSIWVDTITAPISQAGRITGAVQVCRDVSERHEVEKLKDEFVSMVSHELRTPLTAIRGALWLLAADKSATFSQRIRRMLEIALNNTDRLTRLLNDILDCARWESTQAPLARKACSSLELVEQAAGLMRPLAETAGVALKTAVEPCALSVDPDAILQALSNLLSNAIKFSPAGSEVRMECYREDVWAVFRVIDRGPGIPADRLESIFGRFQPVDASDSRRKGGTGLGLYLCRTILERHGGRVWAESKLGQGSTFVVTLPSEHPFC